MAMTLSYYLERRLRGRTFDGVDTLADGNAIRGLASREGLDYDDSIVPGQIVANVLHLPAVLASHPGEIAIALRWGYGSAFGLAHVYLRHRLPEPAATAIFGGMLLTVTFTMFPLLGHTPPPRQWPPSVMATSLGTHAAYIGAAALTDDLLR